MSDVVKPSPARRPVWLLLTMLLCVVIGWSGVMGSCNTLQYYQTPTQYDPPLTSSPHVMEHEDRVAFLRAMRPVFDAARSVRLPLAVANLLLSALLIFAAGRVLKRRAGARSLVFQALGANVVLTLVDYVLARPLRGTMIALFASHFSRWTSPPLPPLGNEDMTSLLNRLGWISARVQLTLSLAVYALAAFMLHRESTRRYLEEGVDGAPKSPDANGAS